MSPIEIAALAAAAALAGAMNSIAGGGTVLTFPLLLFFGAPPLTANATSTLALVIGTAGSILGFRRQARQAAPWITLLLPASLIGGGLGSWLLLRGGERLFLGLAPWLLLFASALFLLQGFLQGAFFRPAAGPAAPACAPAPATRRATLAAILLQTAIAIYGGYFGAGIGILMLATLGLLGMRDIHRMNAVKNVLASAINTVAAAWFICAGLIDWPRALLMSAGALCGYYGAARFSQQIPPSRVRLLAAAIGLAVAVSLFLRR